MLLSTRLGRDPSVTSLSERTPGNVPRTKSARRCSWQEEESMNRRTQPALSRVVSAVALAIAAVSSVAVLAPIPASGDVSRGGPAATAPAVVVDTDMDFD